MTLRLDAEVAVIGAGIAGASAAAEIAATHRVVVLERESQPGYHTTGRSAALYTENYGNGTIRALTVASRPLFERPPPGFADVPLLRPRGALFVAGADADRACNDEMAQARARAVPGRPPALQEIGLERALGLVPVLRAARLHRALHEPAAMDMDVHAIHHGFLRLLRARGGRVATDAEVTAIARENGAWRIETRAGTVRAGRVVNAAGAWADDIARLAGARPVGLVPKRRTALTFAHAAPHDATAWPMVCEIAEAFYFKPESGRILLSPADETPSPPCDAQPEEIDVATAVDRLESWTTLKVGRVERKWAGLRSFVADKTPVVGEDPALPGLFWLAGQGGYGIMTSPALGRLCAALLRGEDLPPDIRAGGVEVGQLSPRRRYEPA